jgi:hypothetical protein
MEVEASAEYFNAHPIWFTNASWHLKSCRLSKVYRDSIETKIYLNKKPSSARVMGII